MPWLITRFCVGTDIKTCKKDDLFLANYTRLAYNNAIEG